MKIEWKTFTKKRTRIKRGFPTGTVFYTGGQGKGKTLSASHYIERLKLQYPDSYIYSNIKLKLADKILAADEIADHILDRKIQGDPCNQCTTCIAKTDPDYFDSGKLCDEQTEIPIIFFLDEIQTILFSSKKSVSFETFRAICQQRKALKTIVGTMQEFLDLDIKYRRQVQSVVECMHFGAFQIELWKNPETMKFDPATNDYQGRTKEVRIWKRHDDAFSNYDTYEIVNATMGIDQDKRKLYQKQVVNGSTPV